LCEEEGKEATDLSDIVDAWLRHVLFVLWFQERVKKTQILFWKREEHNRNLRRQKARVVYWCAEFFVFLFPSRHTVQLFLSFIGVHQA